MKARSESAASLLDLLRRSGSAKVSELADTMGVTATAVRQKLTRLIADGLVERHAVRAVSRGRPSFRYSLSKAGYRAAGTNYDDLAKTLWNEIRAVEDPEVRQGLLERVAERLAAQYRGSVDGETLAERMASFAAMMEDRGIPCNLDVSGELPILTALACPYPDLAESDRGVCAMERHLFAEVLGERLRLTECRLDGATCCSFKGAGVE